MAAVLIQLKFLKKKRKQYNKERNKTLAVILVIQTSFTANATDRLVPSKEKFFNFKNIQTKLSK
jgi:hypothetical protein